LLLVRADGRRFGSFIGAVATKARMVSSNDIGASEIGADFCLPESDSRSDVTDDAGGAEARA
jgi:hypothetical protein